MVFSSLKFIFVFLPLVLAAYFAVLYFFASHKKIFTYLNLVLLVSSLVFYIEGEKKFFFVMLLVGFIDYFLALLLERGTERVRPNKNFRRFILLISVVSNMGLLFYFKYFNFVAEMVSLVTEHFFPLSHSSRLILEVSLPIGISFYTFESMSYIIDVYRCEIKATRRFIDYWTFITFFPHLVAGPIIRYIDLRIQLESRTHNWQNIVEGSRRFSVGLAKKVIIANPLGYYADIFYALDPSRLDSALAWITAATYSLQIYFDFSGYSDMAVGLAKLFGITLPENFNFPYAARSMRDFWRRWHITLSQWFRDYLYIPLGGNRGGPWKEYRNLFLVFTLCGLWHGASLNFLGWGVFHGLFLVAERLVRLRDSSRSYNFIRHLYAIVVILFSWVIFRSENFAQTWNIWKSMLGMGNSWISQDTLLHLTNVHFLFYFLLGIFFCIPLQPWLGEKAQSVTWLFQEKLGETYFVFLLIISAMVLCGQEYNPFIYFRF
jgi:alginate O-acetyltransferase complex protein AlgI